MSLPLPASSEEPVFIRTLLHGAQREVHPWQKECHGGSPVAGINHSNRMVSPSSYLQLVLPTAAEILVQAVYHQSGKDLPLHFLIP